MSVLFAIIGATILIVAGDALVRGAIALSLKLGLSIALISLTVVAFGTSAPELVISVQAALEGSPDIALGNVVGSNVANILLVLGAPALIALIPMKDDEGLRNYLFMVGASVLLLALAWYGEIGRMAGAVMLLLLAGFLWQAYTRATQQGVTLDDDEIDEDSKSMSTTKTALLVGGGIIGLPIGAHLLIEGARDIAMSLGVSEAAIGLTLVALGTSLPELAASIMAAFRGRMDVALGNVVGSNLLNILAILGVTSLVTPVPVSAEFATLDIPIMLGATLILLPYLLMGKSMGRLSGLAFVALYIAFVAAVISGN